MGAPRARGRRQLVEVAEAGYDAGMRELGNLPLIVAVALAAVIAWSVKHVAAIGVDEEDVRRRANRMLGFWALVGLACSGVGFALDRSAREAPFIVVLFALAVFMLPALLGWRDARSKAAVEARTPTPAAHGKPRCSSHADKFAVFRCALCARWSCELCPPPARNAGGAALCEACDARR
jgi:hypothetical protein